MSKGKPKPKSDPLSFDFGANMKRKGGKRRSKGGGS
jgi:hypothetical protein